MNNRSMFPKDYVEKVYASILAMNAGIRLGAPVEPHEWTPEMIKDVYGDVRHYLKDYEVFSADDDANGPIFFLRACLDYANARPLTAEQVGNTWLNYTRDGLGMIWWGGDLISTEHTVYNNLRKGIKAPASGSIATNGQLLAEQIGGQIFIDFYALLFPNNPSMAANYAEIVASVSHDGEGIYGARFIAACISSAFTPKSVKRIIEDGLEEIPTNSTYAKVVRAVLAFHSLQPDDFYVCRQYLEEHWGYDKYGGVCHIIPNAGVCVLALLYGDGDISRTIEIATMCGWDTDCNAGNVGSIVGVLKGLTGIEKKYRTPINDLIVASSVSGYLNIVDLPTLAKQVAILGYRENGLQPPPILVDSYKESEIYFDFLLDGSTHGFKTSNPFKTFLRYTASTGYKTKGTLEIFINRMFLGDVSRVYYGSFYRREQFNDEKYSPCFAPTAYSGQTVSMQLKAEQFRGEPFIVMPYIRTTSDKVIHLVTDPIILTSQWQHIQFEIPDVAGDNIDQVGIQIISNSERKLRAFGKIYLDEFHIYGTPRYTINFTKQVVEFRSVTPFAHHKGQWALSEDAMTVISEEDAASFTGHYYMAETDVTVLMKPVRGAHQIIVRAQGIERYYSLGFEDNEQVSIAIVQDGERKLLANAPFSYRSEQLYEIRAQAIETFLTLSIDGEKLLQVEDTQFATGMVGMASLRAGECSYYKFCVNA